MVFFHLFCKCKCLTTLCERMECSKSISFLFTRGLKDVNHTGNVTISQHQKQSTVPKVPNCRRLQGLSQERVCQQFVSFHCHLLTFKYIFHVNTLRKSPEVSLQKKQGSGTPDVAPPRTASSSHFASFPVPFLFSAICSLRLLNLFL